MDDINDLEAMAKETLHPDLEACISKGAPLGPYIKHPLVFGFAFPAGVANRHYAYKLKAVEQAKREGNWDKFLWLHERPYRLPMLATLWSTNKIDLPTLRVLLLNCWMDTELPYQFGAIPRRLFKATGFITDSPDEWDAIPDPLTVYRGASRRPGSNAISWTVNRDRAAWFARRLRRIGKEARLWRANVAKSDVMAYIGERGESEVIVQVRQAFKETP
jgi:hypothetical protein